VEIGLGPDFHTSDRWRYSGVVNESEVLELCDLNLAEATREMARWHPASEIEEHDGILRVAGADPFPIGFTNATLRIDPGVSPDRVLNAASQFFAARERGYTLWTSAHADTDLEKAAIAAGLQCMSLPPGTPGMVLEKPTPEAAGSLAASLRFVEDAGSAADFGSVSARAYATMGLPESVSARTFEFAERFVRPHVISVVAYLEDEPVSAAMAILSHGIAGLYWVGTVESGRRRGLGEACTRAAGNAAFERGARFISLQASAQGEPIYRRMGYREVTRYQWYASLGGSS
jgi:ribosomal protein S18 acetylase RimI-like enzyme